MIVTESIIWDTMSLYFLNLRTLLQHVCRLSLWKVAWDPAVQRHTSPNSVEERKRKQDLVTAHRSLPPPPRAEPAGAWGVRLSQEAGAQRTLVAQILCESHRHSQCMLLSNGESAIEVGRSSRERFGLH